MKKTSILIIFFLLSILPAVFAEYPFVISEGGINHAEVKEIVYSIPEKYYEHIDVIEFIENPFCKVYDEYGQQKCDKGYAKTLWHAEHNCYFGKIYLTSILKRDDKIIITNKKNLFETLQHELGHIYELCELKKEITTEEFAKNFRIQ